VVHHANASATPREAEAVNMVTCGQGFPSQPQDLDLSWLSDHLITRVVEEGYPKRHAVQASRRRSIPGEQPRVVPGGRRSRSQPPA
jgi:hypothetical protein